MRYLSVTSGIEAATTAWHSLGWEPVAFSEIEPFPCKVLAHHYPEVPNLGDMTKFHDWKHYDIDLLVGGTPCQSFSVAGLRKGLDDPRGNLMLTFLGIADRYKPKWILFENVPGLLSSNGGRDFGTFLGALGKIGYGFAYRILDAQFVRTDGHPYAVPQRRRRVFVVGHLGDWRRAAAVLFDSESLRGNPPPSRETRQTTTHPVAGCATSSRMQRIGDPTGQDTVVAVAHSLRGEGFDASEDGTGRGTPIVTCMAHGQGGAEITEGYAPTLNCNHEQPIALVGNTINRQPHNGGNGTGFDESGAMYTLTKTEVHAVAYEPLDKQKELYQINCNCGHIFIGTLSTKCPSCKKITSGCTNAPMVDAVAFRTNAAGQVNEQDGISASLGTQTDPCAQFIAYPLDLRNSNRDPEKHDAMNRQGVGVGENGDPANTLSKTFTHGVVAGMQVRRLTPLECTRLQGFPDDYLLQVPGLSDSAIYKMLGNSMAVNCMSLLGERIAMVDALP